MKKHEVITYSFDELSDEAKEKAIERLCDINVDYEWWEYTYDDAKRVGIKITSFELDRRRGADGEVYGCHDTATKILSEHGEDRETYKTAKRFIDDYDSIFKRHEDPNKRGYVAEDHETYFDNEIQDIEDQFKYDILEDYSIILQHECDYLMGEEAIIETIKCNEYEFTEDGHLF